MLFILLQKVGLTSYTITLIGLQLFEPFLCALCCLFKCQLLMALKCWIMIENDKQLQWLAGKNQYLFFPLINAQETGCRWRTRDEVFWLLLVDKKLFPLFTFQRYGFPGVYFQCWEAAWFMQYVFLIQNLSTLCWSSNFFSYKSLKFCMVDFSLNAVIQAVSTMVRQPSVPHPNSVKFMAVSLWSLCSVFIPDRCS